MNIFKTGQLILQ